MTEARPQWLHSTLYPFEDRFAEIDGQRVHYVDEGVGPVLLMVHGNPTWSFVYRDVIKQLKGSFRCIAPDLPGFGLSTATPDYGLKPADHARVLAELIRRLDLREVTLVVQDWGGPIGLWAAEQMPERFSGLVIGNTWAWPVNGDFHFESFSWIMGGPLGRRLIKHFNLYVRVMVPSGHRRRRLTPAERAHYREPMSTPGRRRATSVFPAEITGSRELLAEIERGLPALARLPALIVWGDADFAFRAKERERWESILSDRRTVILEGAGHYLQSDAPEEFATAIADWYAARAYGAPLAT